MYCFHHDLCPQPNILPWCDLPCPKTSLRYHTFNDIEGVLKSQSQQKWLKAPRGSSLMVVLVTPWVAPQPENCSVRRSLACRQTRGPPACVWVWPSLIEYPPGFKDECWYVWQGLLFLSALIVSSEKLSQPWVLTHPRSRWWFGFGLIPHRSPVDPSRILFATNCWANPAEMVLAIAWRASRLLVFSPLTSTDSFALKSADFPHTKPDYDVLKNQEYFIENQLLRSSIESFSFSHQLTVPLSVFALMAKNAPH